MKPLILITNDDGLLSPGIAAAVHAVKDIGDCLIVAPETQQTSMSRSFPKGELIGTIREVELSREDWTHVGYSVIGSPAQAVSHAVLELAPRLPDLCISGINYGENLGFGILPSGTIGAAFEANSYRIPSLAINVGASIASQHSETYDSRDWATAEHFTRLLAAKVLDEGLAPNVALLNVNIPADANPETPTRTTVQSRQDYFVFERPSNRDKTRPFKFKVLVAIDEETLEPDSDIRAFALDNVVSITPISWDLTARRDAQLLPPVGTFL